jgi:glycosyltransferase involved in cell wall biosynthesis
MSNYNFTIIIPCINEYQNIRNIYQNISSLNLNKKYNYYFLYVDDGSTDGTWDEIKKLKKENKEKITGLKLSKNFGKDIAISAAMKNLKDNIDFAIIMDCDGQHPYEYINDFINEWENGYEAVITRRTNTTENFLREVGSAVFYKIINNYTDLKFITKSLDFMLIDKKIIDKFNSFKEKRKSLRATISLLNPKIKVLDITIKKRMYGESKYRIFSLTRYGFSIFTSFSIIPIKITGYFGFFSLIVSTTILLTSIVLKFFFHWNITLNTILLIFNTFIFSILLVSTSFLGIYITKILENTNERPEYIINEEL